MLPSTVVHYVAKGIFITKYYFKSARWDTDMEEKAQITVTKTQLCMDFS
jgi:hypothetical protein